jgi:hypothetical protein
VIARTVRNKPIGSKGPQFILIKLMKVIKSRGRKILILLLPVFFNISCQQINKNHSHQSVSDKSIIKGKELAASYCQSCHMLPDPSQLDSKSWENGVLPAMGPRLGIFYFDSKEYPSSRYDPNVGSRFYTELPVISFDDWQHIIDYYSSTSPDTLPALVRAQKVMDGSKYFNVKTPERGRYEPTTTLLKIDTTVRPYRIWIGDMSSTQLYEYNNQLRLLDSLKMISPVVDIEVNGGQLYTCNIGVMKPNNGKSGSSGRVVPGSENKLQLDTSFHFGKLARPVQISAKDFNGDQKTDFLVCEFGNLSGSLTWMENKGNNEFERHVLRNFPGAIKAYIRDMNGDQLPDIMALFAQGDEGIFEFINKGGGNFEQRQLLRFPAVFGSSYFELADFNKDGFPDILYTCGDNADYSPVLKPYHGIYIFINDGKNKFNQQCFLPMYGCFKAIARDFDNDGKLDIAAISFFADYNHNSDETFLYFHQLENLTFDTFKIPGTSGGRWLTMDAGDMDGDGKEDILLGNFSIELAKMKNASSWKNGAPYIMLNNTIK